MLEHAHTGVRARDHFAMLIIRNLDKSGKYVTNEKNNIE